MSNELLRIKHVNRIHEIEEPIFRDWLNGIYLQDVESSQLEIFTGAVEEAIKAADIPQNLKDNVTNSRNALKKPNLTEKSLESEARYFRHCCMIAFVIGLDDSVTHGYEHESEDRSPYATFYDHARHAAEFVMRMYYDVDTRIVANSPVPVTRVSFLDPSGTMTNKLIQQRKIVTTKAANALRTWAGQDNYSQYFDVHEGINFKVGTHDDYGYLKEAGKTSLRTAIELADPTRVEQEKENE